MKDMNVCNNFTLDVNFEFIQVDTSNKIFISSQKINKLGTIHIKITVTCKLKN